MRVCFSHDTKHVHFTQYNILINNLLFGQFFPLDAFSISFLTEAATNASRFLLNSTNAKPLENPVTENEIAITSQIAR